MVVPFVLFLISVLAVTGVLILPGLFDFVILAGPCAVASLGLLLHAIARRAGVGDRPPLERRPSVTPRWILVDGSNVMHWKDGTPHLDAVQGVLRYLAAQGYTPGVVFDANAGYLISGKYQHHKAMGALLGLSEDRVMVVGKGSSADPVLLAAARDLGARIVTNDRYRDWAEAHPEVAEPGFLIKGGFRDSGLWLDLEEGAEISLRPPGISSART